MMTPMILFRGRSNAIEADVHYIPLEKDFSNVEGILARLGDLEYLQGFADRAYRRLVKSGDYGHRSFARLIGDTIEEQYPLRFTPSWVTYRSQVAERRTSIDRAAEREIEEVPLVALSEKPTALPLGSNEFNKRQLSEYNERTLIELKKQLSEYERQRLTLARRAWRLIPTAQRYWIASLIRPVWLLLPMRVRHGIVSSFL